MLRVKLVLAIKPSKINVQKLDLKLLAGSRLAQFKNRHYKLKN